MAGLEVDLLIVGGGIHGAGIARDAAGRGLKVLLTEQGDLAGATSSASSKLAHGGLRYLELGDFRLVREALRERQTLMRIAPHLVRPMPFFLPCGPQTRPPWQIRAGLLVYDWMAGRSGLPRSRALDLSQSPEGAFLQPQHRRGFCYYDGWADDARLVVANVLDAAARGAIVTTRTRCVTISPRGSAWSAQLIGPEGRTTEVIARAVANATGPWVERFLRECTPLRAIPRTRLVKGSHLVIRRAPPCGRAMLLQNDDGRVVFVVPFESEHALIGTTDVPVDEPGPPAISQAEIAYLCRAVNRYLAQPISEKDVVWSLAGVRALFDDGAQNPSRVTRDYSLQLDYADNHASVLSIFGGKLTTYRRVAEEALAALAPVFPKLPPPWTFAAALPGGCLAGTAVEYAQMLQARYPGVPHEWVAAIARRHGALAETVLGDACTAGDFGVHFGADLTAREIEYMYRREWAQEADDVLWRRTKAGLHLDGPRRRAVAQYLHALARAGGEPVEPP